MGRTAKCQVAVSLHPAGEPGSCCIGLQLCLPEEWTCDPRRCRAAGVPEEVGFLGKLLMLDTIRGFLDALLAA